MSPRALVLVMLTGCSIVYDDHFAVGGDAADASAASTFCKASCRAGVERCCLRATGDVCMPLAASCTVDKELYFDAECLGKSDCPREGDQCCVTELWSDEGRGPKRGRCQNAGLCTDGLGFWMLCKPGEACPADRDPCVATGRTANGHEAGWRYCPVKPL